MKKYHLMAFIKENTEAMNYLGYFYQFNEINYDLTKNIYIKY